MITPFLTSRSSLAVVVVAAALLAAGCGGSSDDSSSGDSGGGSEASPASAWADGLCTAITAWTSSISTIGDAVKAGDLSKDTLTNAVDTVTTSTAMFTSDLKGLGRPDTEAGQQAADSLDQLVTDLEDGVAEITSAFDGASGITAIIAATPVLLATLATMSTQITSAISGFEAMDVKGELESAFTAAPACTAIAGS
ncbi:MAG: hypothetical protein EXQ81_01575 [Thermoleophilia bacterium]|nr:hypothetical protein [Thermoleophilia bacterium]